MSTLLLHDLFLCVEWEKHLTRVFQHIAHWLYLNNPSCPCLVHVALEDVRAIIFVNIAFSCLSFFWKKSLWKRDFEWQRSPASSYKLERRSCFVVFLTVMVLSRCQPLSFQLAILLSKVSFVIRDKVDYEQVWPHGLLLPRLDVSTPHSHT